MSGQARARTDIALGVGCLLTILVIASMIAWSTFLANQAANATPSPSAPAPTESIAADESAAAPSASAPASPAAASPARTAAAPQATSVAPGVSLQPAPTVVAQLTAPRGFVAAPDPAGGVAVQWAQLSLGVDPVSFSVRVGGVEAATVPFQAGVVDYRTTLPAACGSIDVTVAAVGTAGEAETAPVHVEAAACP